ncbi:PPC domain-containing DNA-binding protein [Massilia horti]|uniref:DNA-binding protein n=1 Tax=Massilia horti TaxID=2562153 RepID=A0A4Y9SWV3_9BURK|nr:PPC domain-containing DNA-binding protein [Massilia horti]TFW29236.1 DNA-binding protein [Massilia horti]
MHALPLRFPARLDLRAALGEVLAGHQANAGFVVQGIGSLTAARIRLAGMDEMTELHGDLEILSLAGSLSPDGVHLHIAVADAQGRVTGGHMGPNCIVRTTAEVLVALLPDHRFSREPDALTGYNELSIRRLDAR